MADNYLEKKMEEHRAGKAGVSYRPKTTPRGNRPGELLISFTPCNIFIDDILCPAMTDIVKELVGAGFKVSFSLDDLHKGSRLAATLGCRYLPPTLSPDESSIFLESKSNNFILRRGETQLRLDLPSLTTDNEHNSSLSMLIQTIAWGTAMLANLNDFNQDVLKNIKIEGHSL